MIVVVGNPVLVAAEPRPRAGGLAVGIAAAAATTSGDAQLVGKTGDDHAGEAVLLDLAGRGVGHVAMLRDPSRPTPVWPDPDADAAAFDEPGDDEPSAGSPDAPVLEAADLELALRYLPDYRVLVIADALPPAAIDVAVAAAGWTGAALIVLIAAGTTPPELTGEATVLQAPTTDPDDEFAAIVGAYAAALDRGEEPAEAFATASTGGGWSAVSE